MYTAFPPFSSVGKLLCREKQKVNGIKSWADKDKGQYFGGKQVENWFSRGSWASDESVSLNGEYL